MEDIGDHLPFEKPYWEGEHALDDEEDEDDEPYPLPFDPIDLSEVAMLEHLGFQFQGYPDKWVRDPMEIPIMRFRVSKPMWWKFW